MKLKTVIVVLIIILIMILYSCSKKDPNHTEATLSQKERMQNKIDRISKWVKTCNVTAAKDRFTGHDFDMASCDTGDAVLFNGLLCSSGVDNACKAVYLALNEQTGQWYRSEFYKNRSQENSFSRDMSKGVLLYLAYSKDKESAKKWLSYIKSTGKLCTDDTDQRCSIPPSSWALFGYTWDYIGLDKTVNMIIGMAGDDTTLEISAKYNNIGFELHLVAVSLYLEMITGQFGTDSDYRAVDHLVNRQPNNPFFNYLKYGATPEVIDMTLNWCPDYQPAQKTQWSFERNTNEQANKDSMGHECIFLLNKLMGY